MHTLIPEHWHYYCKTVLLLFWSKLEVSQVQYYQWDKINSVVDPDPFDTDPDPNRFKEVMYLKQYFLHTFTWFSLSVGPTGTTQKVFFVKFSLHFNFFVPIE
jgi:hypothetical protein